MALELLRHVLSLHLKQVSWLDYVGRGIRHYNEATISMIAKTASDFATISASNRERILHVIVAAHADHRTLPPKSHIMSKSMENESESNKEKSTLVVSDNPTSGSENSSAAEVTAAKVTDAMVIDYLVEIPLCNAGETTWLAFKCILSLVKALKDLAISETNGDLESQQMLSGLVNGSFAPSVSMLQHFIRRMLGSPVIVTQTLSSYEELACASMSVDSQSTNVRRQAILMSLCKLCLPSWGKRRRNW